VVVRVESIGDAAETTQTFQAADDIRSRSCCARVRSPPVGRTAHGTHELVFDRFLELLDRVAGTCRRLDLKDRPEDERVLLRETVCAICFS
jgi:hypothetical protein